MCIRPERSYCLWRLHTAIRSLISTNIGKQARFPPLRGSLSGRTRRFNAEPLLGNSPRGRRQVLIPESPDPAVIRLGEGGHPPLAQASNDGDRRAVQPASLELFGLGVLEDAEQPELLAGGSLGANLVVAAHGAVHGLPASAARELRRRGVGDIVQDRKQPRSDLDRASGQELVDRDATVRLTVIDDVPAQRMRPETTS
jgi:hypothetical protein